MSTEVLIGGADAYTSLLEVAQAPHDIAPEMSPTPSISPHLWSLALSIHGANAGYATNVWGC